jgi:hypothetical protein
VLGDVSTLCDVAPPPGLYGVVGTGVLWAVSTLCAVAPPPGLYGVEGSGLLWETLPDVVWCGCVGGAAVPSLRGAPHGLTVFQVPAAPHQIQRGPGGPHAVWDLRKPREELAKLPRAV